MSESLVLLIKGRKSILKTKKLRLLTLLLLNL